MRHDLEFGLGLGLGWVLQFWQRRRRFWEFWVFIIARHIRAEKTKKQKKIRKEKKQKKSFIFSHSRPLMDHANDICALTSALTNGRVQLRTRLHQ